MFGIQCNSAVGNLLTFHNSNHKAAVVFGRACLGPTPCTGPSPCAGPTHCAPAPPLTECALLAQEALYGPPAEEKGHGSISLATYYRYFRAGGNYLVLIAVFTVFLLGEVSWPHPQPHIN